MIWQAAKTGNETSVCTSLYVPLVGLKELTDNRGITHSYKYDNAGRLTSAYVYNVLDYSQERIQSFTYGKNRVSSKSYSNEESKSSVESILFYDAWGRPSVYATQGIRPNGHYSYSLQTYDRRGRSWKSFLTVPSNNSNGELLTNSQFEELSTTAFDGDSTGFSTTCYDALGRETETFVSGRAWMELDKSTKRQYLTNTSNEVRKYTVSGTSLVQRGYYEAGTLDCIVTTDPDGLTISSYKDVFGNVILERRAGDFDTYYVYDNFNRLTFVLPPKYQEERILSYYAYQYKYDEKGRMIQKKFPGCAVIRYWYDNADRLVKMQDPMLRASKQYRVWEYDGLGRIIAQRITRLDKLQYDEIRNFYDDYNFINNYMSLLPSNLNNEITLNNNFGTGQLTGVWQRASDGSDLLSVYNYDLRGYLSKKTEVGLDNHISINGYENNLLGNVLLEHFEKYQFNTSNGILTKIISGTIENKYDYSHTNLLSSSVINLIDKDGNMRTDTIMNLSYDDFGHIKMNDRGGTVADMTYDYDKMHGWITGIKSGGLFEQKLYRENSGKKPCFNGNISAMSWKTGNSYLRRFDYQYDTMNRLKKAEFSYYGAYTSTNHSPIFSLIPYVGMDNEDYTSEYGYDKNGNLLWAYRQGLVNDPESEEGYTYDTMDDFNVEYMGNRKVSVNGTGTGSPSYYGSSAFVDGVEYGTNEYAYNENGQISKDLNKGITQILYDPLNNLQKITFSGNRSIEYVYAADGTRLKTIHSQKRGNVYLKDSVEYCGNLIYKNGAPNMYRFGGGYISFKSSLIDACHYYIQDYQGSNRMVVNANDKVEQITHYYPYGGVIGGIDKASQMQNYKFEGKELDRTYGLEWYDIHARQYDPVVPSWNAMDPLAEKYYHISPYAYCMGNPVNFRDINGDSIFIDFANQEDILNLINTVSEGEFGVDDYGYLFLKSDKKTDDESQKFSTYYRDELKKGINSGNKIFIKRANKVNFMKRGLETKDYGNGFTANIGNNAYSVISPLKTDDSVFKYVLAHELAGHAIPSIISPFDYDPRFDGLAVTAENIIRAETGEPLREWGDYEKNDWAVGNKVNSLFRVNLSKLYNLFK